VKMFIEYLKNARGPYKASAITDYFENKIIDDMATLVKDV